VNKTLQCVQIRGQGPGPRVADTPSFRLWKDRGLAEPSGQQCTEGRACRPGRKEERFQEAWPACPRGLTGGVR
jgi:hypothetical protein